MSRASSTLNVTLQNRPCPAVQPIRELPDTSTNSGVLSLSLSCDVENADVELKQDSDVKFQSKIREHSTRRIENVHIKTVTH